MGLHQPESHHKLGSDTGESLRRCIACSITTDLWVTYDGRDSGLVRSETFGCLEVRRV